MLILFISSDNVINLIYFCIQHVKYLFVFSSSGLIK